MSGTPSYIVVSSSSSVSKIWLPFYKMHNWNIPAYLQNAAKEKKTHIDQFM